MSLIKTDCSNKEIIIIKINIFKILLFHAVISVSKNKILAFLVFSKTQLTRDKNLFLFF